MNERSWSRRNWRKLITGLAVFLEAAVTTPLRAWLRTIKWRSCQQWSHNLTHGWSRAQSVESSTRQVSPRHHHVPSHSLHLSSPHSSRCTPSGSARYLFFLTLYNLLFQICRNGWSSLGLVVQNPEIESYINSLPSPDPNDDAEVFSGPINSGAGDYGDYEDYGDYHYRSFFPRVRTYDCGTLHCNCNYSIVPRCECWWSLCPAPPPTLIMRTTALPGQASPPCSPSWPPCWAGETFGDYQ